VKKFPPRSPRFPEIRRRQIPTTPARTRGRARVGAVNVFYFVSTAHKRRSRSEVRETEGILEIRGQFASRATSRHFPTIRPRPRGRAKSMTTEIARGRGSRPSSSIGAVRGAKTTISMEKSVMDRTGRAIEAREDETPRGASSAWANVGSRGGLREGSRGSMRWSWMRRRERRD